MSNDQKSADEALADEWAAALEEQEPGEHAAAQTGAETAHFRQLQPESEGMMSGDVKIDAILDVPITIAMEIGRSRINIRNLLQLNQGSVVELDRLAGEPMDVLVNGTLIAQGEVVVVNEKFGIRLTDIVSPADRVRKLSG
jgi:flagellar motor switch protein FliN/FliY